MLIYEKALQYLPGSYKLWYNYLREARENLTSIPIYDKRYEVLNELHERALIFMNKVNILFYFIIKEKNKLKAKNKNFY